MIGMLIFLHVFVVCILFQKASEYKKEMPHSQTKDQPTAPRGWRTEH